MKIKKDHQYNINVGAKIRKLRILNHMSQIELAYKLGYNSTGAISQIEMGKRGMGKKRLLRMAEILGINPLVLLSDTDYSEEQLELYTNLHRLYKADPDSDHLKTIKLIAKSALKD